jgi:hypothetical protein
MNIYECDAIIKKVDDLAIQQDGEITEEQIQELTEAHTGSIESLGKLCNFMKYLEIGSKACKDEEARIKAMRTKADNRLKSIKKYLTPYVREHGKQAVGTFALSLRKSESVEVDEWFDDNPDYSVKKTTYSPDKKKIKEALKDGVVIVGASLVTKQNLQFK